MLQKSAKTVFHGELQEGKRSQGSQTKRYKDTFKASFKNFNIPTDFWEQATQDRTKWRWLITNWELHILIQRESVKLQGRVKKEKQEPRDHHQTRHSRNSLFATDRLCYTAINEHTILFRI